MLKLDVTIILIVCVPMKLLNRNRQKLKKGQKIGKKSDKKLLKSDILRATKIGELGQKVFVSCIS